MKIFTTLLTLNLAIAPFSAGDDKVLPVLNSPIANFRKDVNTTHNINLDDVFGTEVIDDHVVRFTSQTSNGSRVMEFSLFSTRTPVTRTNFLKYVTDGDYDNSFIHRTIPGFVIQGGGFYSETPSSTLPYTSVPTDAPIVNEFGISNTYGTVSMAKLGGDPDSATSQWFVSLGANSDNLDAQNGGFTVFGRITKSTLNSAVDFGNSTLFTPTDKSGDNPAMGSLPLIAAYTGGAVANTDLVLFPSVSLVPINADDAGAITTLAYSVIGNSNPALVNASVGNGNELQLSFPSQSLGVVTLTVRATDSVGNTVDDTFEVTLMNAYTSWRLTEFSPSDAADDTISAPGIDHNNDGVTNLELYIHGLSTTENHAPPVSFYMFTDGPLVYPAYSLPIANLNGISVNFQENPTLAQGLWSNVLFQSMSSSTLGGITTYQIRTNTPISGLKSFYRLNYELNE